MRLLAEPIALNVMLRTKYICLVLAISLVVATSITWFLSSSSVTDGGVQLEYTVGEVVDQEEVLRDVMRALSGGVRNSSIPSDADH